MQTAVQILSAIMLFSTAALANGSQEKCANVALKALTWEGPSRFLNVSNGDIETKDRTYYSKFTKNVAATEVSTADGTDKIIFLKTNGKIQKVIHGVETMTLNPDCNLTQIIQDDKDVLYDRELCQKIASNYQALGFNHLEAAKCERASASVQKLILQRNADFKRDSAKRFPLAISGAFTPLSYLTQCALEFDFENRQEGVFSKARVLTENWYQEVFIGKRKPTGWGTSNSLGTN